MAPSSSQALLSSSSSDSRCVYIDLREAQMSAVGSGATITSSHIDIEQTFLKLVLSCVNKVKVQVKAGGVSKLPASVIYGFEQTTRYIERVSRLAQMAQMLDEQADATVKELILVGITGSGKTELAIAYTKRYQAALAQICTLSVQDASSTPKPDIRPFVYLIDARQDYYLASFEGLAMYKHPETGEGLDIDVEWLQKQYKPASSRVARAIYETQLARLIHQRLRHYPGWLLIFDGITHIKAHMTYLKPWIPKGDGLTGTVLYTSQDTRTVLPETEVNPVDPVHVLPGIDISPGFTDDEAIALLEQLTGIKEDTQGLALKLAMRLDKLPLALQVAGRHIAQQRRKNPNHRDTYDYVWYQTQHEQALGRLTKDQEAFCQAWGIAHTQYVAVGLSIQDLAQPAQALSQELLDVCSLLCERELPEALLRTYTTNFLGQDLEADIEADVAMTGLRERGLLNIESLTQQTWRLHQTTHAYARLDLKSRMASDKTTPWMRLVERLLDLLNNADDNEPEKFTYLRQIYPHVVAFVDSLDLFKDGIPVSKIQDFLIQWFRRANTLGYPNQVTIWYTHPSLKTPDISTENQVEKMIQYAFALAALGKVDNEIGHLMLALEEAKALKQPYLTTKQIDIYGYLAAAYGKTKNEAEQQSHWRRALQVLRESPQDEVTNFSSLLKIIINILGGGGTIKFLSYDDTKWTLDLLLALGQNANEYEYNRLRMIISNAYLRHGCVADAEKLINESFSYFAANRQNHLYSMDYCKASFILGNILGERGLPGAQIVYQEQALAIQTMHYPDDSHSTISIRLSLSNAYTDLGHTAKAKALLINQVQPVLAEQPNEVESAYLYTLLGRIYVYDGDVEQAKIYFLAAQKILEPMVSETKDAIHITINLYLGIIEFENNRHESMWLLSKAMHLLERQCYQRTRMRAMILFYMAKVNYQDGKLDLALKNATESRQIFQDMIALEGHPWTVCAIDLVNFIDKRLAADLLYNERLNLYKVDMTALVPPVSLSVDDLPDDGAIQTTLAQTAKSTTSITQADTSIASHSDIDDAGTDSHSEPLLESTTNDSSTESLTLTQDSHPLPQIEPTVTPSEVATDTVFTLSREQWSSILKWGLLIGGIALVAVAITVPIVVVTLPASTAEVAVVGGSTYGPVVQVVTGGIQFLADLPAVSGFLGTLGASALSMAKTLFGGNKDQAADITTKLIKLAGIVGIKLDAAKPEDWQSLHPGSFADSLGDDSPIFLPKIYARARHDYIKLRHIELGFKQDEVLRVLKQGDDWWLCQSKMLDIGLIHSDALLIMTHIADAEHPRQIDTDETAKKLPQERATPAVSARHTSLRLATPFFKPEQLSASAISLPEASPGQRVGTHPQDYGEHLRVTRHIDLRQHVTYEFELVNRTTLNEDNINRLKQIMQTAYPYNKGFTESDGLYIKLHLEDKVVASELLNALCEHLAPKADRYLPGVGVESDSLMLSGAASSNSQPPKMS